MPKPLTLPTKLDRFPPIGVRLLARRRDRMSVVAITDPEIVLRSGLSAGEVRHLSKLTSWERVDVGTMLAFCRGCGADLDSRDWLRKNAAYMASIRSIPAYLRRSSEWSSTFEPLISIWVRHAAGTS